MKYKLMPIAPIVAVMLAAPLANGGEGPATRALGQDEIFLLAQTKATKPEAGKEMRQVQDHMAMMQRKMERYHASNDQKERAKLRAELYADMRDHMKLMREPGGMMSGSHGMMRGDAKQRQEMMEMRMDQTHQMMEWMFTFQSDFPVSAP